MKYDKKAIMKKAWSLYRQALKKGDASFSDALKKAWAWGRVQSENKAKINAVADALGIEEEFHTWAGWKVLGRMVMHESIADFQVEIVDPTTKTGTRVLSYFVYSQTQHMPAA